MSKWVFSVLMIGPCAWAVDSDSTLAAPFVQRALLVAKSIKTAADLRQSKLPDDEFYRDFVNFGAASSLTIGILGSWEFADRVESLFTYELQIDREALEKVKALARSAREVTGIVYSKRTAIPLLKPWWRRDISGAIDSLVKGDVLKLARPTLRLMARAISKARLDLTVFHEFTVTGRDSLQTSRLMTNGKLIDGGEVHGFQGPIDRYGRLMLKFYQEKEVGKATVRAEDTDGKHPSAITYSDLRGIQLTSVDSDPEKIRAALRRVLFIEEMEHLLNGDTLEIPDWQETERLTKFLGFMKIFTPPEDRSKVLKLTNAQLEILVDQIPREKGVKWWGCDHAIDPLGS